MERRRRFVSPAPPPVRKRFRVPPVVHPIIKSGKQIQRWFDVEMLSPNELLSYYLTFSYLYYERDVSPIQDADYDRLCNYLQRQFDEVDHPHKPLVDRESLKAGTGYHLKYTNMIRGAAVQWFNTYCVF